MEERFLTTPDAVASAVKAGRTARGWTQTELAAHAGVGRRFIIELEAGHERAELAKVLAVLHALDIRPLAVPFEPARKSPDDVDLDAHLARYA